MSGRIFFQAQADDQAPWATTNVATVAYLHRSSKQETCCSHIPQISRFLSNLMQ
jgi:hypothetical protein